MRFSALQWLATFILDVLIKGIFVAFVGMAITSTSPYPFFFLGFFYSLFHFVCLFLGFTGTLAFELVGLKLRPTLAFWLALFVANGLFAAGATLSDNAGWGLILVMTNLMAVLFVLAGSCISRRIGAITSRS